MIIDNHWRGRIEHFMTNFELRDNEVRGKKKLLRKSWNPCQKVILKKIFLTNFPLKMLCEDDYDDDGDKKCNIIVITTSRESCKAVKRYQQFMFHTDVWINANVMSISMSCCCVNS